MLKRLIIAAVIVLAALFLIFQSGSHLTVDHPERSDAILVLAGDRNDVRYWRGLELLRAGYGHQMILDEGAERMFGRTYAEHAAEFAAHGPECRRSLQEAGYGDALRAKCAGQ